MRKIDIEHIQAGSKLARPIYNANGQMLLSQGTVMKAEFLERLKRMGYTSAYIYDGLIDDVTVDEVIAEETRQQAVQCIREIMDNVHRGKTMKVSLAKKAVSDIINDLISNREMMLNLSDIRSYDDYTFNHSVNVTVISLMIGISMHYTQNRLQDLGLGVILHDIGKLKIPPEIINKPDKLTAHEYEMVQNHTWHGYEALRNSPEIKITSAHVALQHHEHFDGSGYPRRLKGKGILEFARVSAIADVYDALSNDRCYRKKLPAYKVYEFLLENAGKQFDSSILDRFIQKIALYPQGTKVKLSDGRSGLVLKQNNMNPSRPMVRLFWLDDMELPKPEEVNLLLQPSLEIVEVIE